MRRIPFSTRALGLWALALCLLLCVSGVWQDWAHQAAGSGSPVPQRACLSWGRQGLEQPIVYRSQARSGPRSWECPHPQADPALFPAQWPAYPPADPKNHLRPGRPGWIPAGALIRLASCQLLC